MVRHNLNVAQSSLWGLKTRSVAKTEQILLVCFQKPNLEGQFTRLCGNGSRLVLCGVSPSQHEAAFDGTTDPRLKAFWAEMAQEWQTLVDQRKGSKSEHTPFRRHEVDPGD
jgi:hypothetical protein